MTAPADETRAAGPLRVAAIDAGTNSTRLLIAEWDGIELHRLRADSRITRLGRGVDATGRLDPAGLEATLACMADYLDAISAADVSAAVAVATSAARDATNSDELLATAEGMGAPMRILTGDEEAQLSFMGATWGAGPGEQLVIDAGGGSTEFVIGSGGEVRAARSVDLGCVRLTERHLSDDPPTRAQLEALAAEVTDAVGRIAGDLEPLPDEAIAVGGTATTLAAIAHGLADYDSDVVDMTGMRVAELRALRDRLSLMTVSEIDAMPIVQAGRADVLVAGASLLLAAAEALGLARLMVRDRDMLDGLVVVAALALEG